MTSGLFGRDPELALVSTRLTAVATGAGGILVVLGEPGIGKTRLLTEAARLATHDGLIVLTARAASGGDLHTTLPEQLRPAAGPAAGPGAGPGEVAAAVVASVDRLAPAGCLLVLDDLHLADSRTLAVVEHVAAAAAALPLLLAVAARDDGPAAVVLDRAARRPGGSPVWLARLRAEEVAALAAERTGSPLPDDRLRDLLDRTDGLPSRLAELLPGPPG